MHCDQGLERVLGALRRPRDEAQWTQVIVSVAGDDADFAGALVRALVEAAPNRAAADALAPLPVRLRCFAEESVSDDTGRDLGRVDLSFRDDKGSFCLFAELKLHSDYGHDQLERYRRALEVEAVPRRALLAVTKAQPLRGEQRVSGWPGWLGSIRWASVYDALLELEASSAGAAAGWRAALAVLRSQGDFGPMDFDPDAVFAWARRDEAEKLLRYLLGELAGPTLTLLREAHGGSVADDTAAAMLMRGQSTTQPIVPWRNNMHIDYTVPAAASEPRFRIQFMAVDGQPHFAVEGRFQYPSERLTDESIRQASDRLRAAGFAFGNDGSGYYWARVAHATEWLAGADTLERLLELVSRSVEDIAANGLFSALDSVVPATAAGSEPPGE